MSLAFARSVLKVAVAQTCQNIGWHAVQSSPLEMLVDILHRYLTEVSSSTHMYCNQYGRTEPTLLDLSLAFRDMGIQLNELEEYINNVEPTPFVHEVSSFPVPHPSNFQHPKIGSREVLQRSEAIHEHLPSIHPELDDEEPMLSTVDGMDKKSDHAVTIHDSSSSEELSPASSPHLSLKRPLDALSETTNAKRPRLHLEEEGRPMREVTCVFMTPSGFITPNREGKLPDARAPLQLPDSRPTTPDIHSSDSSSSSSVRLPVPLKKELKLPKMFKKVLSSKKSLGSKKDIKIKFSSKKMKNKENSAKFLKSPNKSFLLVKKGNKSGMDGSKMKKKNKNKNLRESSKFMKMKAGSNKIKIAKIGKVNKSKSKDILKISKQKHKSSKSTGAKMSLLPLLSSPKLPKGMKSPARSKSQNKKSKSSKSSSQGASTSSAAAAVAVPPAPTGVHVPEVKELPLPVKIEALGEKPGPMLHDVDDLSSHDESPEPRLVIDDEAQARQEKESRMAVLDECIDAVIERAKQESELENQQLRKEMDDTINEVIRGTSVHVSKKMEPRDIYDFTDSSNSSPPTPKTPEPMGSPNVKGKKEKIKILEMLNKHSTLLDKASTEGQKKKKTKSRKKTPKESKAKGSVASPKQIKTEEKKAPTPLPVPPPLIKLEDSNSNDDVREATPPPLPVSNNPFHSPPVSRIRPPSPPPSLFTSMAQQKFPSMGFCASPGPFTPVRTLSSNPFPTPPLFVSPTRTDGPQLQPLNLAVSTGKSPGERKTSPMPPHTPPMNLVKMDNFAKFEDKPKGKKDKVERRGRKPKKEKAKPKAREVVPPKEKPKPKVKPKVQRKGKADKKKEQAKEDASIIPKITFKLDSSASSSAKIVIKSTPKGNEEPRPASPAPIPKDPTPPPSPPSKPPPTPPPPVSTSPLPPVVPAAPPVSGTGRGRQGGRGRGGGNAPKKVVSSSPSTACTVITETLGTIMDESGNKIWICPACTRPDDGSPMIGCDECDDWYHWVCVSIVVPPKEEESWFCTRCISKRQSPAGNKKRKKKHKRER